MISGIRSAVLLNYFSLPLVLAGVVCIVYYPPFVTALLLIAFVVEAHLLISLVIAIKPRMPLSSEIVPGRSYIGLMPSLGFGLLSSLFNVPLLFLVQYCGVFGGVLACMALIALMCIAHGLNLLASNRLSAAEIDH